MTPQREGPASPEFWRSWLVHQALPLWSGVGINDQTGLPYEALDMEGAPCQDMALRIRVPARQVYCFATAARLLPETANDLKPRAEAIFDFLTSDAVLTSQGHLAGTLTPRGEIIDAPHELYDIAFFLLAAAAMAKLGHDVGDMLDRVEKWLALLDAAEGWNENAAKQLPRRQNPHMHLFEASIALSEVFSRPQDHARIDRCLKLFRDRFGQEDGTVLEYFDADFTSLAEWSQVEPGHMAEWVWLIDRFELANGRNSGVDLTRIWEAVLNFQLRPGLLPDQINPALGTCRLWPQTEFLKAALVMERRGQPGAAHMVDVIITEFYQNYIHPAPKGGWIDKRDSQDRILSNVMPASSFYHILEAVLLWLETRTSKTDNRSCLRPIKP